MNNKKSVSLAESIRLSQKAPQQWAFGPIVSHALQSARAVPTHDRYFEACCIADRVLRRRVEADPRTLVLHNDPSLSLSARHTLSDDVLERRRVHVDGKPLTFVLVSPALHMAAVLGAAIGLDYATALRNA